MQIGDLFERDVERPIPPVVYFHEQEPVELQREVEEYIVTGGYPQADDRGTDGGIHEQFVRLLGNMRKELDRAEGVDLPNCWISGFYGSGKSSFAKLLGLSLDGRKLPGGKLLADALLAQDHSPAASDFAQAWRGLTRAPMQAVAVVFDVGSKARDGEQVHAVIVRQVQAQLRYSATSPMVAEVELALERENEHDAFLDAVQRVHRRPWSELRDSHLVEDYFSAVLHAMKPALYPEPMAWVDSHSGAHAGSKRSPDEAAQAIADMLRFRAPKATLFVVVDEVSQYVHDDEDRILRLQSFATAIGQRLKGKVWLLATGQKKLEDGDAAIAKLKDRFPPALRVHLGPANIRDVVHRRLLRKKKNVEGLLGEWFDEHRPDLSLHAYEGAAIERSRFVDFYPMLPGHFDLILDITTGLRERSTRTQGDSTAIRGLMQLLGDLFREKKLVHHEIGRLVTIDVVYDVLGSALDADVQLTLGRAFDFARQQKDELMERVIKAVAMLELVQERKKTSPELVARCLYAMLGQGNHQPAIEKALDALRGHGFLGYSEKTGYKIESSAGQEWQRERDAYEPAAEQRSALVVVTLTHLLTETPGPKLENLTLPWLGLFSDGLSAKDVHIKDERKHTVVTVDFQLGRGDEVEWIVRTAVLPHKHRIVWVVGDIDGIRHAATQVARSSRMIERYGQGASALSGEKQRLLTEERNRLDGHQRDLARAVEGAFLAGQLYFGERSSLPRSFGTGFKEVLSRFAQSVVPLLYPHPTTFAVTEKETLFLIENKDLAAPPPVFGQEQIGLLALDAGRYVVTCNGRVPTEVLALVKETGGVQGSTLLERFGGPPHGVLPDVIRATVIALLRAQKIRVEITGVGELTSVSDEGARELLKDSGLRKAKLTVNTVETVDAKTRNAICLLFKDLLQKEVARDNDAIADAVAEKFVTVRERLTAVAERFRRLPRGIAYPEALTRLESALEACRRDRRVEPTVLAVKKHLAVLRDGLTLLTRMETDLTEPAMARVATADDTRKLMWPGLCALGADDALRAAAARVEAHLATERPWEDTGELGVDVEAIRAAYRERRRAILDGHAARVDQAVESLKLRPGMEKLDPDQRHQVLRPLKEGTASSTDERAIAPPIEALEAQLGARRDLAEARARAQLDALLEGLGATPVVELDLTLAGREIETEAELDRLLGELRRRILHELAANHRVRLK